MADALSRQSHLARAAAGWTVIRQNSIHILIGLTLGAAIIGTMAYLSAWWNDAVVFEDVQAAVSLQTREHVRWLAVKYHVAHERACPSWSQHAIYRDNVVHGEVERNFVPLAITANGLGAALGVKDFDISFRLPDSLLPGRWHYVVVTSASCEWLPGLQREAVTETVPVPVDIP